MKRAKRNQRHKGYIRRMFQDRGEIPNRRRWDYDLHDEIEEAVFLFHRPDFCGVNDFADDARLGDEWLS